MRNSVTVTVTISLQLIHSVVMIRKSDCALYAYKVTSSFEFDHSCTFLHVFIFMTLNC